MIACSQFWSKSFRDKSFLAGKFESCAYVNLISSLFLLLVLFVLAGTVCSSFLSGSESCLNTQLPVVNIQIEACDGGLSNSGPINERVRTNENLIILVHKGGNPLLLESTSVKIHGYGNSYRGTVGSGGGSVVGDTFVYYTDLRAKTKNPEYQTRNKVMLEDGYWSQGEKLILCGKDSAIGALDSSVKVNVNETGNTSDNYGFKAGSEITLFFIDTQSGNVLAKKMTLVDLAGK